MSKKRALGRGLSALIPMDTRESSAKGVEPHQISVDNIEPNPHQPRQVFDPELLQELALSIEQHGLIQPLIVSKPQDAGASSNYILIAGERRLEAAKLAGLQNVPVIIKEATPQQMLELALVENIQRADLDPLEEALAYQHLSRDFGLTQQEIADRVGKGRVSVANTLRLLRLPAFVQDALAAHKISEGHARALLSLGEDTDAMQLVLKRIIQRGLSVRQTEELVRRLSSEPASKSSKHVSPETREIEAAIARSLGTKVNMSRSKRGGKITIHFYSDEELQKLYDLFVEH